jgi:dienelactone hydrolase
MENNKEIQIIEAPAGYVFKPVGEGPFPGVVILHGSLGGWGDFWNEKDAPAWPVSLETRTAKLAEYFALNGIVAYHAMLSLG